MRVLTEHVYECEPDAFWAHHLDEASRRPKEVEGCGAISFRVLSKERQEGLVVMRSEVVEAPDVPAPIRRIFGTSIRAEEILRWHEGSDRATFEYIPETMPDRARLSGTLATERLGDGRCLVTADIEVTVKIFGVGSVAERILARELPERQEKAVAWFNANLGALKRPS